MLHVFQRDLIRLGTPEFDADVLRFAAVKGIGAADTLVIVSRSLDVPLNGRWRLPDTDQGARYRVVVLCLELRVINPRTGRISRRGRFTFDGTGTTAADVTRAGGPGRDLALFARLTFGAPVVDCGGGPGAKGRRGVNGLSMLWNGVSPLRDEEGNAVTVYTTGTYSGGPPYEIPLSSPGGPGRPGGPAGAGGRARLFTTFNINNPVFAAGGAGGAGGDGGRGGGQTPDAQLNGIPVSADGAPGPKGSDGASGQASAQKINGFEFMRLAALDIGADVLAAVLARLLQGIDFVRRRPGFWSDEAELLSRALEDVDYLARTLSSTRNIGVSAAVAAELAATAWALRSSIADRRTPVAVSRDAYVRPVPTYWRERAERQRALITPALQMIAAAVQSLSLQDLRRLIIEQEARTIGYEAAWLTDELSTARAERDSARAEATRNERKRAEVQEKLRQRQQTLAIVRIDFGDFLTLAAPLVGLFAGLISGGPGVAKAVTSGVSSLGLIVKQGESGTLDVEKFIDTVATGAKGLADLETKSKDIKDAVKPDPGASTNVPNWGQVMDIAMTLGKTIINFNQWIERVNNAQFTDAEVKSLTVELLSATKAALQTKAVQERAERRLQAVERRVAANQQRAQANASLLATAPPAGAPQRAEIVQLLRSAQQSADIALTAYTHALLAHEADTLSRKDAWLDLTFGHVEPDELDHYTDFGDAARLSRAMVRSLWPAAHVSLSGAIDLWRSTRELRANGLDRLTLTGGIGALAAGQSLAFDIPLAALPATFRHVRLAAAAIRLVGAGFQAGTAPPLEFELVADGDSFERNDALTTVRRTLARDRLSVVSRAWSGSGAGSSIVARIAPGQYGDGAPTGLFGRPLAGRWELRLVDVSASTTLAGLTSLDIDFDYVYRDEALLPAA